MKFEILRSSDARQPYYWRIVFRNGRVAARSETYVNKIDARDAITTVKREAATAPIVDLTTSSVPAGYR